MKDICYPHSKSHFLSGKIISLAGHCQQLPSLPGCGNVNSSAYSENKMYKNFRNCFLLEMANKLLIAMQISNLGK